MIASILYPPPPRYKISPLLHYLTHKPRRILFPIILTLHNHVTLTLSKLNLHTSLSNLPTNTESTYPSTLHLHPHLISLLDNKEPHCMAYIYFENDALTLCLFIIFNKLNYVNCPLTPLCLLPQPYSVVSSLVTPTVRRNSSVSSPHYSHQSNTCRASSIPPPPPTRPPQPTNQALCLTTEEHQQHYPHLTPSPTDLYMSFPPRVRQNTDTTAHHCFHLRHRSVDSNSTNALQCAWITSWCNSLRYAPLLLLQTTTSPKHALLSTLPLTRSSVQYLQLHRS